MSRYDKLWARRRKQCSWLPAGWRLTYDSAQLPSCIPGALFVAELTVGWTTSNSNVPLHQADALAWSFLWKRAKELSTGYTVHHLKAAQAEINAYIGSKYAVGFDEQSVGAGKVSFEMTVTGQVVLGVEDGMKAIADSHAAAQRDEETRSAREDARLNHLKEIFSDPGSGHLWWADHNPELLNALKDGSFEELVKNAPAPAKGDNTDTFAKLISDFLGDISSFEQKQFFLVVFERVLTMMDPQEGWRRRLHDLADQELDVTMDRVKGDGDSSGGPED